MTHNEFRPFGGIHPERSRKAQGDMVVGRFVSLLKNYSQSPEPTHAMSFRTAVRNLKSLLGNRHLKWPALSMLRGLTYPWDGMPDKSFRPCAQGEGYGI